MVATERWTDLDRDRLLSLHERMALIREFEERPRHRTKATEPCTSLLKLLPAPWTFVTVPGVEPTNNANERVVRLAVPWRKGSFGDQGDAGAVFVACLLSVAATCHQQDHSLLDDLTAVCTTSQPGHPIPSLLPESAPAQAA